MLLGEERSFRGEHDSDELYQDLLQAIYQQQQQQQAAAQQQRSGTASPTTADNALLDQARLLFGIDSATHRAAMAAVSG